MVGNTVEWAERPFYLFFRSWSLWVPQAKAWTNRAQAYLPSAYLPLSTDKNRIRATIRDGLLRHTVLRRTETAEYWLQSIEYMAFQRKCDISKRDQNHPCCDELPGSNRHTRAYRGKLIKLISYLILRPLWELLRGVTTKVWNMW